MLIISRKKEQSIVIGEGDRKIVITVTDIRTRNGQVRIGLEAPDDVLILRSELVGKEPKNPRTTPARPHSPDLIG